MKQGSGTATSVGAIKSSLRAMMGYRSALILVTLLLFTPAVPGHEQSLYPTLDAQFEPLRAQFDHDVGRVRLLILLDPT